MAKLAHWVLGKYYNNDYSGHNNRLIKYPEIINKIKPYNGFFSSFNGSGFFENSINVNGLDTLDIYIKLIVNTKSVNQTSLLGSYKSTGNGFIYCRMLSNGFVAFSIGTILPSVNRYITQSAGQKINDGKDHCIILERKNGLQSINIDGAIVYQNDFFTTLDLSGDMQFYVGRLGFDVSSQYFEGNISEISLHTGTPNFVNLSKKLSILFAENI